MEKIFSRVLLVDDDHISNYLSSSIIKELQITDEIVVLKNGQEALDYITNSCISDDPCVKNLNLLLLDLNMAVVNGFELLEALHYTNFLENLKIVILSSSQNPKDIDEATKYRIYGYLTKPLSTDKLQEVIEIITTDHLKFTIN